MIPAYRENWGWERDREDSDRLRRSGFCLARVPSVGVRPNVVDPRPWLKVKNQGETLSCGGFAGSNASQMLAAFQFGGKTDIVLSAWQAYISAQTEDNLLGPDNGVTITGLVRALQKRGICTDASCPFTGRYFQEVPQQAWIEAELRQVRRHVEIRSAEEAFDWIGGGMGAIIIGVPVDRAFMSNRGIIDIVPRSGGGHAMAIVGYTGDGQFILVNSWGTQWGNKGFSLVTQQAFDSWCQMVRSRWAEVWGISDMENPKPRTFSVDEWVEALLPKFD